VDVLIHPGRSLDTIMQAEVIRPYGRPLATDYPRYTAGTAMLETAERLTPMEKEPAIRQFLLLIGGLRALGEALEPDEPEDLDESGEPEATDEPGEPGDSDDSDDLDDLDESGAADERAGEPREPRLVLDSYLLRSLALEGYAPALTECARCGRADDPLVAFAVAAGGMVCANCRPPGAASPAPATVALMRALVRGDWETAMRSERRHRVECSGLVAAYLQWHLEHSIRSLRHVERA
jgi:DNA repair protein RecO (recombination protein O)